MPEILCPHLEVRRADREPDLTYPDDRSWNISAEAVIDTYWSGETAPAGRHFSARLLWTKDALFCRFEAQQTEPVIALSEPDTLKKAIGLWERDVCEIFVAPDPAERRRYFEFEVAPTGEWLDVAIDLTSGERAADWKYRSQMRVSAKVDEGTVTSAVRIGWEAFGRTPEAGDVWFGNLLRCVGTGPSRGYLAWSPTFTPRPDFHVPERFGEFRFAG